MPSLSLCRRGKLALAALGLVVAQSTLAQQEPSCEAGAPPYSAETLSRLTAEAAEALLHWPTSAPHHSALARLLARSGRPEEAAAHFQTAAELAPASLIRIAAARPYSQSVYAGTAPPPVHDDIPVGSNGGWAAPGLLSSTAGDDVLPAPSTADACPDIDVRSDLTPDLFRSQYVLPGKPVLLPVRLFRPAGAPAFDGWAREPLLRRAGRRRTAVIWASSGVAQAAYAGVGVAVSGGAAGGAPVAVGSGSSAGNVPVTLEQFVLAAETAEMEAEAEVEAEMEAEAEVESGTGEAAEATAGVSGPVAAVQAVIARGPAVGAGAEASGEAAAGPDTSAAMRRELLAAPTNASLHRHPPLGGGGLSFDLAERFILERAGRDPPYLFSADGALAAELGSQMKLGGLALGSHFLPLDQAKRIFFLGPPLSGTFFHAHSHTLNILSHGAKLWLLLPPGAPYGTLTARRTPAQWLARLRRGGRGAAEAAPPDAPPPLRCLQRADQVLFIPSGWNHATVNVGWAAGVAVEVGDLEMIQAAGRLRG